MTLFTDGNLQYRNNSEAPQTNLALVDVQCWNTLTGESTNQLMRYCLGRAF